MGCHRCGNCTCGTLHQYFELYLPQKRKQKQKQKQCCILQACQVTFSSVTGYRLIPGWEQLRCLDQRLQGKASTVPRRATWSTRASNVAHLSRVSVTKEDSPGVEAAREKQVDMLKTLMSDILRSVCTLLKQQLAGWVAVFIPARLWQSPGERRRDPASTASPSLASSYRWLRLSRWQPTSAQVQP